MANSHRLRIDLDRPISGWLKVELSFGDQNYSFIPSHVPYDSISELVKALLQTLDGYDNSIVRWNDEPLEHEFVFEPKGNQAEFRVLVITETANGKEREQVFTFLGSIYDLVWPFWKALRDMESRRSKREYEKEWREPFPEREMIDFNASHKCLESPKPNSDHLAFVVQLPDCS
jgi:hypothetical protein